MATIKDNMSTIRRNGKTVVLTVVRYGTRAVEAADTDGKTYVSTKTSSDTWGPWREAHVVPH